MAAKAVLTLTRAQVFAWRMKRQFLRDLDGRGAVDVIERLCGVQAQVASAAGTSVAIRQAKPDPAATAAALADRTVIRTWAMRGTLHLLSAHGAPAYLSLLAAGRTWHKPVWQRRFITLQQMESMMAAVDAALADGRALTREELVAEVTVRTSDPALREHVASGWAAVLKPLAWQGLLCQGPSQDNRVTFVRPDTWIRNWPGLPEPEHAVRVVLPAYLGAHGPATIAAFDAWLLRGATPKGTLRRWLSDLGDRLSQVDVEGVTAYARTEDLAELARSRDNHSGRSRLPVRLLPGFDQYVLGPGTSDPGLVAAHRRSAVSRTAGWISPVVLVDGRVAGTWTMTRDGLHVELFAESPAVPIADLEREAERVAAIAGEVLPLSVDRIP